MYNHRDRDRDCHRQAQRGKGLSEAVRWDSSHAERARGWRDVVVDLPWMHWLQPLSNGRHGRRQPNTRLAGRHVDLPVALEVCYCGMKPALTLAPQHVCSRSYNCSF